MAKPNYAYEKRQRELEKKQKKEDKALRKAAGAQAGSQDARRLHARRGSHAQAKQALAERPAEEAFQQSVIGEGAA